MTESPPQPPFSIDALSAFESLEIDYVSARLFRQLLVPRLLMFSAVVAATVIALHMAWWPLLLMLGLECLLISFALQREHQARRRWALGTEDLANYLGIQPKSDIRPMAPSGRTVDVQDRTRLFF